MNETTGRTRYPANVSAQVLRETKDWLQGEADRRTDLSGQWVPEAAVIRDALAMSARTGGTWITELGHEHAGAACFDPAHTREPVTVQRQVWQGPAEPCHTSAEERRAA